MLRKMRYCLFSAADHLILMVRRRVADRNWLWIPTAIRISR